TAIRSRGWHSRKGYDTPFETHFPYDFSAVFPHRNRLRTGFVSIRSCRLNHCDFAVGRKPMTVFGNTTDAGNRCSPTVAEAARMASLSCWRDTAKHEPRFAR